MTWSGSQFQSQRDDLRLDGQFQVEANLDSLAKQVSIAVLDMPAVFTEVDGDSIGTSQLGQHGRPHRVRLASTSGLPEGGDMINVDTKAWHAVVPQLLRRQSIAAAQGRLHRPLLRRGSRLPGSD